MAQTPLLFEIRQLLPTFFMPLKLSLVSIGLGLLWRKRSAILAGLILLYLASTPVLSDSLRMLLENQYPQVRRADCPTADVIVVLSGYADRSQREPDGIQWNARIDRFEEGLQLYRMQKAPVILFTESKPPGMGELIVHAAVERGIPASAVRLTDPAATTTDEAAGVRNYLRLSGARRIVLVTSALHMARAARLFRHAGIDLVPFPVDYQTDGWQWDFARFLPSPGALAGLEQSLHEIYGLLMP
jgi:uncharacterized SAM-binding protein YcdF (DUF218 family)